MKKLKKKPSEITTNKDGFLVLHGKTKRRYMEILFGKKKPRAK
jgi:hypothetical protein